jgi:hypothetical protein
MGRLATDPELEEFARFLARLTLEIERNLRDPHQLAPFMPPRTWELWQRGRPPGGFEGGTVAKTDVGRPRIERLDDVRAIANVVTRTDRHRWGALSMTLDATRGRWCALTIQRLYANRHYRTGPTPNPLEIPTAQRLATAQGDHRYATAALHAVQRRLDELPAGSRARRETTRLSTTWKKVVADLDREITTLQQQHTAPILDRPRTLRRQR